MTGIPLIIAFVLAIVLMIYAISKLNIHPFLAIMAISVIFALIAGIPLMGIPKTDSAPAQQGIADVIGAGFSGTFSSIGIVIIFGALVGILLEKTGAALKMADCVVKLVGKKNPELAMLIMGWIVSIPVFCDSGFVILNPIRKAMVKRTGASSVATTVALSMGLYISHCFIPPTPGPIAAANTLYAGIGAEANLLLVMGIGALGSILPLIVAFFFAKYIGKKIKASDEADSGKDVQTYEELVKSYGKLPNAWLAFSPIVIPIVLMAISSAFSMAGLKIDILRFLGTPIIALAVGVLLGIVLLASAGMMKDFYDITNETLKTVGPILFVTAAGGVLGKVIATSSMVNYIKDNSTILATVGIFFPFILAAILKTAQGSSTVAITTTAGIMAPLMGTMGLATPVLAALTVVAIGAGAMTVSHANDSYFWVVTNFGSMEVKDGYKTQTLGTLIIGLASMVGVFIMYLFMK
ncbi:MAG: GntP family permease [Angelakisella sp.]